MTGTDPRAALVEMRRRLLAEHEADTTELATAPDARGDDLTASQHPADVVSELERREFVLSRGLSSRRELDDVEAALRRLDDGTYGRCVDCGSPIPAERLEALPHAARDIDCERAARKGRVLARR